jgi:peptidoglycan/LPS O-acetylase OafA/YrhL
VVKPISYGFLDGLRGFGALAVYLSHFIATFYPYELYGRPSTWQSDPEWHEPPYWITWIYNSPFHIITNGPFWVTLFFILSGFVLSLRWYKTRNHKSIYGGVFRRYFRLMLPLLTIYYLYYFVAHIGWTTDEKSLAKIKGKYFFDVLVDGTIGVWFGNNDYTYVTWTLSVEMWASFYVFIVAETVTFYQHRWALYLGPILFLYIPRILEEYGLVKYNFT